MAQIGLSSSCESNVFADPFGIRLLGDRCELRKPTLIEWDNNVPPLDVLLREARHAAMLMTRAENETAHADAA